MKMRSARTFRGFTLVELLVVIGIIGLLIAILLPGLQKARRAANSIACQANIRSILQAMHIYAAQNNGAIMGGPFTSSRFLFQDPYAANLVKGTYRGAQISDSNCPSLIDILDWASPALRVMGVKLDEAPASREARYHYLVNFKGFKCPENNFASLDNNGQAFAFDLIPSYDMALAFQWIATPPGASSYQLTYPNPSFFQIPTSYSPKISKVGQGAEKIYIGDGARYSNFQQPPDFNSGVYTINGGAFADQGAWNRNSNSWDRRRSPGSGATIGFDARIYAYRHGTTKLYGSADTMKANFGFFDGHVELLGDLQSANPNYWLPKGSTCNNLASEMYDDAKNLYCGKNANKFTAR